MDTTLNCLYWLGYSMFVGGSLTFIGMELMVIWKSEDTPVYDFFDRYF